MVSCRADGGGCQSNCRQGSEEKAEVEEAVEAEDEVQVTVERFSISSAAESSSGVDRVLCSKCNSEAVAYKNQCAGCFRSSLFGKFKLSVTANAMISPTDKVLVAVSGGPASRVALQFVHEMQSKAQRIWDASKDQSLPVFGVGVAFIDESAIFASCHKVDKVIEAISSVVSSLSPPAKEFHCAPIETLFSSDLVDGRKKLNELLNSIADATGREDLLQHMRMLSLQKIALDGGFNKLVLGWCTSRIASHMIAATVKGQGYSLPADIQYVDARWEVPVVLPLRDCLAEELKKLYHLDGLKMQEAFDRPCSGINGLVSSFIARLQEENPSRARTIVRTAEKLSPFSFNKLSENGSNDLLPSRMRRKFQNVKPDRSTPSEVLCLICRSPLGDSDMMNLKSKHGKYPGNGDSFAASCCQSCCFQILPKEVASFEHFYSLLPQSMSGRMKDCVSVDSSLLREQIKDCLISDDDDGT